MAETIYVKYNRTRREPFQIKTAILSEDGKRAVDKTALSPEGEAHIRSFEEKYRLLSEINFSSYSYSPDRSFTSLSISSLSFMRISISSFVVFLYKISFISYSLNNLSSNICPQSVVLYSLSFMFYPHKLEVITFCIVCFLK